MVAGKALSLATGAFTLAWTHSVEAVEWRETWLVSDQLKLIEARVKGSGAGMEPGEGAKLIDGWWVWSPDVAVERLNLAASGATGGGWNLCADGTCQEIGEVPGEPVEIRPCD